jgi:hypothetical protein
MVTLTNALIFQFSCFGPYRPSLDDLEECTTCDANVCFFYQSISRSPSRRSRPSLVDLEESRTGRALNVRHGRALARDMY